MARTGSATTSPATSPGDAGALPSRLLGPAPSPAGTALGEAGSRQTRHLAFVFTDVVDSSSLYYRLGDEAASEIMRAHLDWLNDLVQRFGGVVIKTMGDGAMAAFEDAQAAVAAALALQQEIRAFAQSVGEPWLALRIGVHTGPCVVTRTGATVDCFGTTVNLAARLLRASQGGDVVISRTAARDAGVPVLPASHACEPAELALGEAAVIEILRVAPRREAALVH